MTRQRGIALVVVLWIVTLLALFGSSTLFAAGNPAASLIDAVRNGDSQAVRAALARGADAKTGNLHYGAHGRHCRSVRGRRSRGDHHHLKTA